MTTESCELIRSEYDCCAEVCLDIVANLGSKNQLTLYDGEGENADEQNISLARIKISLDFSKQSKSVQFRALLEEWNAKRIIQELY